MTKPHSIAHLFLCCLLFSLPLVAQEQRAPADALTGPPFVSAGAWGIYNLRTGERLWGENDETPRSIASTTKIMTALVVIQELERAPHLIDAAVTFSERAGGTRGSGARLETGETLSVRDLLYGLLLPSGNDASVALAEAFGRRFLNREEYAAAAADEGETTLNRAAYDAFIERMNTTAEALGMTQSSFRNPHGLDAEGHQASASDLALLTRETLRHSLFREIVNTRRHVAEVRTADGETREARWNNTNQLLNTEGFFGIKTGTTSRAGACLVSAGARGDDRIIVVVLGSAASAARYVDSRNLYRFAWLEMGHEQQSPVVPTTMVSQSAPAADRGYTLQTVEIAPLGADPATPWVVHAETYPVRSRPSLEDGEILGEVTSGTAVWGRYVVVEETDEEWLEVNFMGQQGYLFRPAFSRVHPFNQELIRQHGNIPYGREIINRWWGIPLDYEADDLVTLPGEYVRAPDRAEYQLRREAAEALMAMVDAIGEEGMELFVSSAYRSGARQEAIYTRSTARRPNQRSSAPPGHSEHQLGTTVDLAPGGEARRSLRNSDPQHAWLTANAARFGWRQTYLADNVSETGYIEEPWHWRYMGGAAIGEGSRAAAGR